MDRVSILKSLEDNIIECRAPEMLVILLKCDAFHHTFASGPVGLIGAYQHQAFRNEVKKTSQWSWTGNQDDEIEVAEEERECDSSTTDVEDYMRSTNGVFLGTHDDKSKFYSWYVQKF